MNKIAIAALPVFLLTACGSEQSETTPNQTSEVEGEVAPALAEQAPEASASDTETESAAAPPGGFGQCRTCHTVEKDGAKGVGPNLWNVAGNAAAQKAGFAYSAAMQSSGLTWDDATLDAYLEAPLKTVPGTKMAYAGLRDDKQRAEVVQYLQSLKD